MKNKKMDALVMGSSLLGLWAVGASMPVQAAETGSNASAQAAEENAQEGAASGHGVLITVAPNGSTVVTQLCECFPACLGSVHVKLGGER